MARDETRQGNRESTTLQCRDNTSLPVRKKNVRNPLILLRLSKRISTGMNTCGLSIGPGYCDLLFVTGKFLSSEPATTG
jgi:hypothetical protein